MGMGGGKSLVGTGGKAQVAVGPTESDSESDSQSLNRSPSALEREQKAQLHFKRQISQTPLFIQPEFTEDVRRDLIDTKIADEHLLVYAEDYEYSPVTKQKSIIQDVKKSLRLNKAVEETIDSNNTATLLSERERELKV